MSNNLRSRLAFSFHSITLKSTYISLRKWKRIAPCSVSIRNGKYPAEGSQFPEVNIWRPYLGYLSLELTESVVGLRCDTNVHNHNQ
ncbi:hypothetical protein NPIL_12651 [Nephila pilipes]|uniref:Uncharacterized protein n=1 Tax=Nephila pilipes TaxID=299642 RepID=A0A8X6MHQ8_NEPPI|nr:hypothetical protein NPIL_12651 [Nephila pilipes]